MIRNISINEEDFRTLAICAVRYCQGQQSYMPGLIQGIVLRHLDDLDDNTINVMLRDCTEQEERNLYGDEKIDKSGWIHFREKLGEERIRRWKP